MTSSQHQGDRALARRWHGIVAGGKAFGRGTVFIIRLLVSASPRLAAALVVLTLIQAALPVMNVRLAQIIVNNLAAREAVSGLVMPLVVYVGLHVVAAALVPSLRAVEGLANERIMGQIQILLLSRLNALTDLSHFEDPRLYDEVRTLGERAQHLPRHLLRQLGDFAAELLAGTGLCLMLASLHPLIPLILLVATIPSMMVQRQNSELTWGSHEETVELERRQQYWIEVGTGPAHARDVQLFGITGWIRRQFARSLEELDRRRWRLRRRILVGTLATLGVRFLGTAGILVYLVARGLSGQVRPGDFVLFLGSLLTLEGYLRALPFRVAGTIDSTYLSDRFLAFLRPDEAEGSARSALRDGALREGLVVEHLAFRYPGREEAVLSDVSFRIRAGETVALVGRNGAGKTTLVKLLTGLYRPAAGSIWCGSEELSKCEPASVRAKIAVAFQDHCRYFLTAGENIGLGCVDCINDQERIARAAQDGGAEPLIERMENGYATRLGREFGGTQLSGGEWQKLALSRAFMRDADLLILDEPTAALDVRAEAEIYQRFQTLLGGRAGLLISHRFSTVRMAHRILVLDGGRIVEEGSHDALMARGGLYAEMFQMQAEAFRTSEEAEA